MIAAGIDIGSITAKAALVEDDRVLAVHTIFTGYNPAAAATQVYARLLSRSGIRETAVRAVVAT
ncbi:MAG: 2-hydroxyglutaryl-CoA dehydratase, partial [Desulfotignum sp.]